MITGHHIHTVLFRSNAEGASWNSARGLNICLPVPV